jgi:hypothetical protein
MWLKKLMHKWFGWEYAIIEFAGSWEFSRAFKLDDGDYIVKICGNFYLLSQRYTWKWLFKNK